MVSYLIVIEWLDRGKIFMEANFKSCVFGGFDRGDVIGYIEKSAKESQERIEALEIENAQLTESNERIESALRTLHTQVTQYKQEEADRASCQQQLAATQERIAILQAENERLRQENDTLRSTAEEYARLKEHIADIEISAHRRTEEFRAEAFAKLHQCIESQRSWCQTQRERYAAMNDAILQDLRRAENTLVKNDLSGFDDMLETLHRLEDTLE